MRIFSGLSAFPMTPATASGAIDFDGLAANVERIIASGADSIGVLGSTGTYAYHSMDSRNAVARAAIETAAGRVPVLIGVGHILTRESCVLAECAAQAGASGLFMAPVSYTPLTDAEVMRHYETVAAATELPLCIYNNPSTTHFTFSPNLIGDLSKVPAIQSIKMPPPADNDVAAVIDDLRGRVPTDFAIGFSGDWMAATALGAGAEVFYTALGGVVPKPFVAITKAIASGDTKTANAIDARLAPLWALSKTHGSLRLAYALADILGHAPATLPAPLLPLSDDAAKQAENVLEEIADLV